jgi:hypothetical protein
MRVKGTTLARLWGMTPTRIYQLKKEGMPLTSVEAAEAWRHAKYGRLMGGDVTQREQEKKAAKVRKAAKTPEAVERAGTRDVSPASVEEAEAYIRDLESMRNFAREAAEGLWQQAMPDDSRKWVAVHQSIAAKYPALHKQVMDLRERHGRTITTEAAQAVFVEFLQRVRSMLDIMPQALGSKCNPADPDHAIEQLQLWRDASLYPVLAGAPNVSANAQADL